MLASMIALALASAQAPPPADSPPPATRGVRIIEAQPAPQPTPSPAPAQAQAPEPPAAKAACQHLTPDLAFTDSAGFDQGLRRLLASNAASVVVDTPAGFDGAHAPPRLGGWLAEIQRTGGAVNRQDIPCSRTRGFSLLKLLGKIFGGPKPEPLYAPAAAYDATLWTSRASDKVEQVQFLRRPT